MKKGKFIVLEGIDGSGKSTQIQQLKQRCKAAGHKVYTTFEPTNSPIGAMIRNVLYGRLNMDEKTIAALFLADRLDHIQNEVNGMLKYINQGIHVLADRYYLSSYAYHSGYVEMDWVIEANSICKELLQPDLNIFIDITPEESLKRLQAGRETLDAYETKERITRVYKNYQQAIDKCQYIENIAIINGKQSLDAVSEAIWEQVNPILQD